MELYLDNAATTSLSNVMKSYLSLTMDDYYNPSSKYEHGISIRRKIDDSRNNIADFINAKSENIIFTSGGSASNTLAIKGYVNKNNAVVLYSPIAHKSIIKCSKSCKYSYPLKVDKYGKILLDDLKEYLNIYNNKSFVVLDYANSEIGTIQDVKKIIDIVHFYNGKIYLDCTGSITQIPIDVEFLNPDMIGFSGHKIGALKGIGILYKKEEIELEPLIYGEQECGLFAGTENVLGIISIGYAVKEKQRDYCFVTSSSRDYVMEYLKNNITDWYLIGDEENRLPHNLYICFKNVDGEKLMTFLDQSGIQVSTGSACNSGSKEISSTLKAIRMDKNDATSCIRITFSGKETVDELDYLCEKIKYYVHTLRTFS